MFKKLLLGSLILFSTLAWAEPAPPEAGTSTVRAAGTPTSSSEILDHVYLNYFAIYHGASLADLSSSYTLDQKGRPSRFAMFFDSEVTAAYRVDSDIGIGPVIPFLFTPVMGQGFTLGDVGIKAFDRQAISSGGLKVYANLIVQAPTSQSSQARNMSFALKTTPNFRYIFARSRFAVGAWTEAKAYFGVTADKTFKLYAAPYVNYQLSSKLSLNLEYEMEAHHNVGAPTWDLTNYETDLQPGFVWLVTPKIMLNPYVALFTGNRVTLDSTAVGAVISATVL